MSAGRPDRWASPRENRTGATRTGARPTRQKVTFQDEESRIKAEQPSDVVIIINRDFILVGV